MRITPFLLAAAVPLVMSAARVIAAPDAAPTAPAPAAPKPVPWEKEIAAFESEDAQAPPAQNGVLFIGSSSIRGWKTLAEDFPGEVVINRGFGGSQLTDSVRFAPRIVWPYKPRMVVLYAGDNDIAAGKTPEQVKADWIEFVKVVREKLPDTQIAFLAIKPSPARLKLMPKAQAANESIQKWIAARPNDKVLYIDVWKPMLNAAGEPRGELFGPDRLHMNREGYVLWTKIVAPFLAKKSDAQ
ncbi:MAG: hypothetical protein JWN98_45 [Abditibacteriota bacterium]|nr:hypothetical protein [Abditibacteriota bacterium]